MLVRSVLINGICDFKDVTSSRKAASKSNAKLDE